MQGTKLLITAVNEFELGAITNILTQNDIPFITKDNGTGGYMRIYSGSSIYGTDIQVREDCLDKAMDLIANFRQENDVDTKE